MGKKVKITRIVDVTEMGRAGGRARAENLSGEELSAAGKKAIKARWDAYYAKHPDKLKAKLAKAKKKAAGK